MTPTEAFTAWLAERGYMPTSIGKLLRDLQTMATHGSEPPESADRSARLRDYRWAYGLWAEFCEETRRTNKLVEPPEPAKKTRRSGPRRQKPALSIPQFEWDRLEALVRKDASPAARVIEIMMETGLRVGDVLRAPLHAIDEALERGDVLKLEVKGGQEKVFPLEPARRSWADLRARLAELEPSQRVCEGVSKGSGWDASSAAYQAVRRKMQALGLAAGIRTRIHVHRLRRSVGMQLLRAGVPLEHVQRVLGQRDKKTTESYLDEDSADIASRALARRKRPPPT